MRTSKFPTKSQIPCTQTSDAVYCHRYPMVRETQILYAVQSELTVVTKHSYADMSLNSAQVDREGSPRYDIQAIIHLRPTYSR
jgi:hypothetical protein